MGSHSIKIVEARPNRRTGYSAKHMAEVATPPGSYVDGQINDIEALGKAIRIALKRAGVRTRKAALGVPQHVGFIRKYTFPKMPLKELRAAVELQPERYIPSAREGAVWDLHLLPGEAGDGQVAVVIAAAPRKYIADLMAICKIASLKPVRIDLEQLAMHRGLMALQRTQPDWTVGIVDLGENTAKISLFEGDTPVVSRVVDLPHPAAVAAGGSPFAGLDTETLFLDVRRSLEFALTQTTVPPSRIFVTGGAGNDDYLMLSLTAYLRGFLSNRLANDFLVEPGSNPSRLPPSYLLALGLSLPPELFV